MKAKPTCLFCGGSAHLTDFTRYLGRIKCRDCYITKAKGLKVFNILPVAYIVWSSKCAVVFLSATISNVDATF